MSEVITRVFLALVLVNFQPIAGKPIFGTGLYCDFFCDEDYDTSSSTTSSYEDLFDIFFPCDGCPTNPSSTMRPLLNQNQNQPPLNFMIPPNFSGMNVSMVNQNGNWLMNFAPWGPQQATPAPSSTAAPAAPPAGSAPGATTAAPGATTAAPGAKPAAPGATTAAPGVTTAAPTTAAAGK